MACSNSERNIARFIPYQHLAWALDAGIGKIDNNYICNFNPLTVFLDSLAITSVLLKQWLEALWLPSGASTSTNALRRTAASVTPSYGPAILFQATQLRITITSWYAYHDVILPW